MKIKNIFAIGLICLPLQAVTANTLLNDMQACQGLLQFVDNKLESAPAKYPAADVKAIRKGLKQYNAFIQKDIITPGLLKFSAGDKAKSKLLQDQVNDYKKTVIKAYQSRYPQPRLFTDQAMAINNCAKKSVPTGQALKDLEVALKTIIKLAQIP